MCRSRANIRPNDLGEGFEFGPAAASWPGCIAGQEAIGKATACRCRGCRGITGRLSRRPVAAERRQGVWVECASYFALKKSGVVILGVSGDPGGERKDGPRPLGLEGIEAIVLRPVGEQPSLREVMLPESCW